jgi:predicted PurR-regulated permease PerM
MQEEKKEMNGSTPAALNVKRSIDRQRKEQRAVTSILSGVGLGLLLIIVGCATLSAFGGYVLWKQIQQQSVTVAQMEQSFNKDLADLQARDAELASGLDSAGAQLAKQLSSLEQIKSQVNRHDKDVSTLRQRLSMLEGDSSERRR